jgi:hypothetical protein
MHPPYLGVALMTVLSTRTLMLAWKITLKELQMRRNFLTQ